MSAVHPRVGGETMVKDGRLLALEGPSPRGRGNQRADTGARMRVRSIPAWAGKPP